MDGRQIAQVAVGVGVAVLVWRLLRTDDDERLAKEFSDIWELNDPDVLRTAQQRGLITPSQIQEVTTQAPRMAVDIARLKNAPSNWYAWDDDERSAVASIVVQPSYPALLMFAQMFVVSERTTIGAFLASFMSIGSDAWAYAEIVKRVKALRQ